MSQRWSNSPEEEVRWCESDFSDRSLFEIWVIIGELANDVVWVVRIFGILKAHIPHQTKVYYKFMIVCVWAGRYAISALPRAGPRFLPPAFPIRFTPAPGNCSMRLVIALRRMSSFVLNSYHYCRSCTCTCPAVLIHETEQRTITIGERTISLADYHI